MIPKPARHSLIILVLLATAACSPPPALQEATVLPEPRPLPEFSLTTADGSALRPGDLAGRWTLLFFGFANCPDVCPITLQQLATARAELAPAARPDILFVSVDPQRDTQALLAEYAARFGEGVTAATGDVTELDRFARGLGIYFRVTDGDDYTVEHSAAVVLVGPDAAMRAVFMPPHSVSAFINDLEILAGAT